MTISGIVSEFNPFHNGHRHIIDKMRKESDCVVAVMSGNYVQRGEPAVFSKYLRTKAALLCGVDLVIELPSPWSAACADCFAFGAISVLQQAGIHALYFGCEYPDIETLTAIAKADQNLDVSAKPNETFAKARERALSEKLQFNCSEILNSPNCNLSVSYIKAKDLLGADFSLHPFQRIGTAHDSSQTNANISSASYLREHIENGVLFDEFVPKETVGLYKGAMVSGQYLNKQHFKLAVFLKMRAMTDFSRLPDLSEGLENRLLKAVKCSKNYDDVINATKTKRYTEARIRRLALSAFLEADQQLFKKAVPYLNILGITKRGEAQIKRIAANAKIPLIYSGKPSIPLDKESEILLNKEVVRNNIYSALLYDPHPSYEDLTNGVIKI